MKKSLRSITLSAMCIVFGVPVVHSARKPVSENRMVSTAELIVVGTVSSSKSYWDESHQKIWTDYTIAIQETLKGDGAQSTCSVTVLGGEVGDVGLIVSEEPRLVEGEKALLYLKQTRNGRARVLHGRAGAFKIVNGALESSKESISSVKLRIAQIVAQEQ